MLGNRAETRPERISEFKRRKQRFQQLKSHPADVEQNLRLGWEMTGRTLKSGYVVLQKLKGHDEIVEDRFWSVLYQLGYHELNNGRNFKVQITDNKGKEVFKQIDVFAKDDDTVIVAECKSNERKGPRNLQKDIMEFSANRKSIVRSVTKHYGNSKLKFIWLFVTRNIQVAPNDRMRAQNEQVHIIQDRDLRYYEEIAKNIGPAAKYQFLAEFLAGGKVRNLEDQVVPAIRAKIGGYAAYYFLVSPDRLLPISFVNHRSLKDPSGYPTYQRLIKRPRLKQIGAFLQGGGFFPNSILVNFKKRIRFDVKQTDETGKITFGSLYLPDSYKSAWIIDGQHRLYGFTELEDRRTHAIAVVAFENISREKEADLFATINGKQAKVSTNILDELEGDLKFEAENFKERSGAISARALAWLDAEAGGPLNDRMKTPETQEGDYVCLTITELKKAIVQSGLIGRPSQKDRPFQPGPLTRNSSEETLEALADFLSAYFSKVRQTNPERWEAGRPGHLCMNIGVAGHVRLLANVIDYMAAETRQSPSDLDVDDLLTQIEPYLEPVFAFIAASETNDFDSRFKPIFGSGGPAKYFFELATLVQTAFPKFSPAGLDEFTRSRDTEQTRIADEQVRRINDTVHKHVISVLKRTYGDNYFVKGVPQKDIRMKALERQQDQSVDEQLEPLTYLDIVDLKKVVECSQNWQYFADSLSVVLPSDRKGLAKYVSWFDKFNAVRKIMAHPTNRTYVEADYKLLTLLESELNKRLGPQT